MKQGQIKTITVSTIIFFLLAIAILAWTAPTSAPVDKAFNRTETVVVNCTATPLSQLQVLNISLWYNYSGTYQRNQTVSTMSNNTGTVASTLFNISVKDNEHLSWACTYDEGNGTSGSTFNHTGLANITANKTIVGDFQNPVISIVYPVELATASVMVDDALGRSNNVTFMVEDEHIGNASTCIIFTNTSGAWAANVTNNSMGGEVGGFGGGAIDNGRYTLNFSFKGLASGYYTWGVTCNDSAGRFVASANQTFRLLYGPNISIQSPATNNWVTNRLNISYTVQSRAGSVGSTVGTSENSYTCELYTNESALTSGISGGKNFSSVASFNTANATQSSKGVYDFAPTSLVGANSSFLVGLKCYETALQDVINWSNNITVMVDDTVPNVTIVSVQFGNAGSLVVGPANGTNSSNESIQIGVLASDDNLANCTLYGDVNGTSSHVWMQNQTFGVANGDITSGTRFNYSVAGFINGSYDFQVRCEDNASNTVYTQNHTFNVNLNGIFFRSANQTGVISGFNGTALGRDYTGKCDAINITVYTPNLATSVSLNYSSTSDGAGVITSGAGYSTVHNLTLPFNTSEDTVALNWTAVDYYGRSNSSGTMKIKLPVKVCTGWTGLSVTQTAGMTMYNISTQSQADYVYWFNSTRQSWVAYAAGTSTNQNVLIKQGWPFFLNEAGNGTWRRMINTTAYYDTNLTSWNRSSTNYLGIVRETTFSVINATFKNSTGGYFFDNGTGMFQETDTKSGSNATSRTHMNFTYMYAWNNSQQKWVNYVVDKPINPVYVLQNGSTVVAVVLVDNFTYPRNVSWNGTSIHNWSGWAK